MNTDRKSANAVGGKTARACDSCILKRARWYCAADDAFLCQGCDASVHSANSLASRHERVRLKTASLKPTDAASVENSQPAWHQGFTRKARTPRHGKPTTLNRPPKTEEPIPNPIPLVPEISNDEASPDENEEQLLCRVPVFDPFVEEFCTTANDITMEATVGSELNVLLRDYDHDGSGEADNLPGFLPSDMDLAEFAADVESLLGRGLDEESLGMEGLGLLDCKEEDTRECCFGTGRVKVEDHEEEDMEAVAACQFDPGLDLNLGYYLPTTGDEKVVTGTAMKNRGHKAEKLTKRVSLKLDYEAIIAAWASQGSPWTTGDRPQFNTDDCWPDFMDTCLTDVHQYPYGDVGGGGGHAGVGDGGREARVSRYREKRRTRLFTKKIRYEVRKLNAEKRPRMKGRFVKRVSFAGPPFAFS
ncbi:hypothetical protein HHK36_006952 [Tetracentron sinense]|uniref:Uncharacterized protein n=1 Tax=Tetracentron sinense TaxID=13715 RepID=A0A834ZIX4_TETSI|nr:hypothetical protein HHK36_006952 [Tetracentron sinense]